MSRSTTDVAIIGAGPYGLAAAAHLRAAGVETRVFGEPMVFWERSMPKGMLLRSSWDASHIADPARAYTLEAFNAAHPAPLTAPIPLAGFVAYGHWFQQQVVPDVDRRSVVRVTPEVGGFELQLWDGERLQADRVIVAAGLAGFDVRPPRFDGLPETLVSHASDHHDLSTFNGRRVTVVGGGQSALESAALLHEAGAEVEVLIRERAVRWLGRSARLHRAPTPIRRALYPSTDVGPPGLSWIVALPDLFRVLPRPLQRRITARSIRPAGSAWLAARLADVPIAEGRSVAAATMTGGHVRLTLDDGNERVVDHVLLGTGYRVDVTRYPFLTAEINGALRLADGYPVLGSGFESSMRGLHFIGAAAVHSFGPVVRFVSGTIYTGHALARRIAGTATVQRPIAVTAQ
jgi:lysine/ornithine N-monooxygenase